MADGFPSKKSLHHSFHIPALLTPSKYPMRINLILDQGNGKVQPLYSLLYFACSKNFQKSIIYQLLNSPFHYLGEQWENWIISVSLNSLPSLQPTHLSRFTFWPDTFNYFQIDWLDWSLFSLSPGGMVVKIELKYWSSWAYSTSRPLPVAPIAFKRFLIPLNQERNNIKQKPFIPNPRSQLTSQVTNIVTQII